VVVSGAWDRREATLNHEGGDCQTSDGRREQEGLVVFVLCLPPGHSFSHLWEALPTSASLLLLCKLENYAF
jgi:hypothetical protein